MMAFLFVLFSFYCINAQTGSQSLVCMCPNESCMVRGKRSEEQCVATDENGNRAQVCIAVCDSTAKLTCVTNKNCSTGSLPTAAPTIKCDFCSPTMNQSPCPLGFSCGCNFLCNPSGVAVDCLTNPCSKAPVGDTKAPVADTKPPVGDIVKCDYCSMQDVQKCPSGQTCGCDMACHPSSMAVNCIRNPCPPPPTTITSAPPTPTTGCSFLNGGEGNATTCPPGSNCCAGCRNPCGQARGYCSTNKCETPMCPQLSIYCENPKGFTVNSAGFCVCEPVVTEPPKSPEPTSKPQLCNADSDCGLKMSCCRPNPCALDACGTQAPGYCVASEPGMFLCPVMRLACFLPPPCPEGSNYEKSADGTCSCTKPPVKCPLGEVMNVFGQCECPSPQVRGFNGGCVDKCANVLCAAVVLECKGLDTSGCCPRCPPQGCSLSLDTCPQPGAPNCYATFNKTTCTCGTICKTSLCTEAFDCATCSQSAGCSWQTKWAETTDGSKYAYGQCVPGRTASVCVKPVEPPKEPVPEPCVAQFPPREVLQNKFDDCVAATTYACYLDGFVSSTGSCRSVKTAVKCNKLNGAVVNRERVSSCVTKTLQGNDATTSKVQEISFGSQKRAETQTTESFIVSSEASSSSLSGGAIAGIVIGSIAAVVIVVAIIGVVLFLVFPKGSEHV